MDDAALLELVRAGQPPFWSLMAEASGGRAEQIEDVVAAVVPAAPQRSIFNSVFYERTDSLAAALGRLADLYEEVGVAAWAVWTPDADERAAELLGAAGHVLDSEPRAMAMELSEWSDAGERAPGVEVVEEYDRGMLARINELAYGYPEGDFGAVLGGHEIPGAHVHLARIDGETVGCGMAWDHGEDCEVTWIATIPEYQGRGVGGEIMRACLRGAVERGRRTTTLQASKKGSPVYQRIGYHDVGGLQMWERRKPG